jgi:hypothetical protein
MAVLLYDSGRDDRGTWRGQCGSPRSPGDALFRGLTGLRATSFVDRATFALYYWNIGARCQRRLTGQPT